jgi:hypothetical protein
MRFCWLYAILALTACEDSFIDPFANDEKYFTLFGFIDETKNFEPGTVHRVRVVPIARTPQRILLPDAPNASIDAEVYTIHVESGAELRWGHSLEELADGTYGHVFSARFFVQAGERYRLEVRRSDGMIASAETHVPETTQIVPVQEEPVEAASGGLEQRVVLPGVRSTWDMEVVYRLGDVTCFSAAPWRVAYGRVGASSDAGWAFTLHLSDDIRALEERLGTIDWRICSIGVRTRILDKAWTPPGDDFDPEVLADPSALTNVVNGYGFFGSIGLLQQDWLVSPELSTRLGH